MTLPAATALAFALEKVFNTDIGFLDAPADTDGYFAWARLGLPIAALGLTDVYLNIRAAQRFSAQACVPAALACSTLIQYFQSMVIFGELRRLEEWRVIVSSAGAVASLLGALCIQSPDVNVFSGRSIEADGSSTSTSNAPRSVKEKRKLRRSTCGYGT